MNGLTTYENCGDLAIEGGGCIVAGTEAQTIEHVLVANLFLQANVHRRVVDQKQTLPRHFHHHVRQSRAAKPIKERIKDAVAEALLSAVNDANYAL